MTGAIIYSVFALKWKMTGPKMAISGFGAGAKKQATNSHHIAATGNSQLIITAHPHGKYG
ncbi:hypothetical protein [Paraflavitalea speifideaquila]|uniref:hypothetical protein n=1 Tax=Paraflavitalea speifideaquila TaxID=3076558 RepID=UPI0028EB2A9F|nr:hypothetical protein [Paraflavitalea speifideiaquila]